MAGSGDDESHYGRSADHAEHHRDHHESRLGWRQGMHHLQVGRHVAQHTEHSQAQHHAGGRREHHVAVLKQQNWD